jgi:hypothetical protein
MLLNNNEKNRQTPYQRKQVPIAHLGDNANLRWPPEEPQTLPVNLRVYLC